MLKKVKNIFQSKIQDADVKTAAMVASVFLLVYVTALYLGYARVAQHAGLSGILSLMVCLAIVQLAIAIIIFDKPVLVSKIYHVLDFLHIHYRFAQIFTHLESILRPPIHSRHT